MDSHSMDVLTQSWSLMVIRSITTVSSLYMSPVRALPTASDRAPLRGPRGYVSNPAAFVAPWVSRDIVADLSEVDSDFHESLNLVAAASQMGTSCFSLVIMRGIDPTREGVLKASLVTRKRFDETEELRLGTSDHQEFHQCADMMYFGSVGDLALGTHIGLTVWRMDALRKIGLDHLSDPQVLEDAVLSAISMLLTGYVISGKDFGSAGTLPLVMGEDGLVPKGGIAWPFPTSTAGLFSAGGSLPNFGRMKSSDLAALLQTWDVIIAVATRPEARDLLDCTSGSFTPWAKDLCRWGSVGHHCSETRSLYSTVRDSKSFKAHDTSFMASHALGPVVPVTAHSVSSPTAASTTIFGS